MIEFHHMRKIHLILAKTILEKMIHPIEIMRQEEVRQ